AARRVAGFLSRRGGGAKRVNIIASLVGGETGAAPIRRRVAKRKRFCIFLQPLCGGKSMMHYSP
ncbi:MAG: hypothetical protein AAFZ11_15425, partial [Pseudomonadota bacterium]